MSGPNVQKKRLYYYLHALHTAGLETECMHEQHTQAHSSHVGQSSGSDGLPLLSTHPLSPFRKTSSTSSSLSNVFISLVAFCFYFYFSRVGTCDCETCVCIYAPLLRTCVPLQQFIANDH